MTTAVRHIQIRSDVKTAKKNLPALFFCKSFYLLLGNAQIQIQGWEDFLSSQWVRLGEVLTMSLVVVVTRPVLKYKDIILLMSCYNYY